MTRLTLSSKIKPDFSLWGVCTANSPYRLCWLLNKEFEWTFVRKKNILTDQASKQVIMCPTEEDLQRPDLLQYPLYVFKNELLHYEVHILHNRAETEAFSSELRKFDYLLVAKGSTEMLPEQIKNRVQQLDGVQIVLNIDTAKVKDTLRFQMYES